jgi:3-deoxy-manno-octulosonate cytidylyltransferase (CMP-KDO synthetase)
VTAPDARQDAQASCCIVIPARYASTRYPGKPLARLRGADGAERTLIERSWMAARAVPGVDRVLVATDDERIAQEVARFGGTSVMTPAECRNGTERCAAVLDLLDEEPDVLVNLQGDAPLTPAGIVADLIARMTGEPDLAVVTPAVRCSAELHGHLVEDRAAGRVGGTTVVVNRRSDALYFSKNVIPFVPEGWTGALPVHLHLGVYAYRPAALRAYLAAAPSELEIAEGLEQLRFLDIGMRVGAVVCDPPDGILVELNNPSDVPLIEAELRRRGLP